MTEEERKEQRKEKKLYGIVEAVVKSVQDKTIDIHHVFTKEYAKQFVDVDDLDSRYEAVRDWIDSLPYILSIDEDNRGKAFGTVKMADIDYEVHGVEVACFVIKNIASDFCFDGETFLHPELMNRGIVPNILFTTDALWDGWKENFFYFSKKNDREIQFFATSNLISDDLNIADPHQGTDLMRLEEVFQAYEDENHNPIEGYEEKEDDDEDDTYTKPLGIYGFMASLINAMFKDAMRRRIFNIDWYDENWSTVVVTTSPHMKFVNDDDLPKHLHVPGELVFATYFNIALPSLMDKLAFEDVEFEQEVGYSMRKMLDIEIAQSKKLGKSKLWNAFPDDVQQMLLQYERLFIKYLQKNLHIEVTEEPIVEEKEQEDLPTTNPYFSCITEYAIVSGHAQEVENELKSACVSAPKLMKCINTNEALGYVDTKNLQTSTLHRLLNEHFHLKFGPRNLSKYRTQ